MDGRRAPQGPGLVPAGLARGDAAAVPLDTIVRVRLDGALDRFRHIKIVAAPVVEGDGEVEWVGTATDAEEHWRSRMREKLLARMAAVPAAHDLSEAFLTTAAAVVPELADAVAIFRVRDGVQAVGDPSGSSAAALPERVGLAPGLPALPPLDAGFLLGPVARRAIEGQEARLLVFPPGGPTGEGLSDVSVRWLREAGATGVALLPVVVDGRTVALATIATCRGNPPPDEADLSLLRDVFQQMSGPLRRTMELQSIRGTTLALQQSFLAPRRPSKVSPSPRSTTRRTRRRRSAGTGTTRSGSRPTRSPCPSATSRATTSTRPRRWGGSTAC